MVVSRLPTGDGTATPVLGRGARAEGRVREPKASGTRGQSKGRREVPPGPAPGSRRRDAAARARREAIAAAALDVFLEKGFAAARVDDVAVRAGVAKGTIYLHFKDKEALFEDILRTMIVAPLSEATIEGPREDETARAFLERSLLPLLVGIAGGKRGDVVRLLIAEGGRFPGLAETYHREVVGRGLALLQRLGARARARGEPGADVLEHAPQLLIAPALLGLIWTGLFGRLQPLDVPALVETQLDLIFGGAPGRDRSRPPRPPATGP